MNLILKTRTVFALFL